MCNERERGQYSEALDGRPSALHAVQHAAKQTPTTKRGAAIREKVWELATSCEWTAEDWKDFYIGVTEAFARIVDRRAAKAEGRDGPVRAT